MPSPFGTGVAVLLILLHGKEKAASVLVAALQQLGSANCSVAPASAYLDKNASSVGVEKLPEEMNDMKISDDKKMEAATLVDGNGTETGYIIVTTIGGKNGQPKQAKCLETGETVAIKKILQDKKYKNRELKTMRLLDHPNVVSLKHCFFLTTEKDDLYLNLVFEYVPETASWVIRHYNKMNQQKKLRVQLGLYSGTISIWNKWTSKHREFHTRDGDQFQKALEVLSEMKGLGLRSNIITFSMLIVASEKMDDMEAAQMLLSQAKKEHLSLVMSLPLLHI